MRFQSILPLVALFAFSLSAAAAGVDYANSEITFVSKQMNVPVQGRFRKFTAQIAFDPKKLASAKAEIEVDLASIATGSPYADAQVCKKAGSTTHPFPTAIF